MFLRFWTISCLFLGWCTSCIAPENKPLKFVERYPEPLRKILILTGVKVPKKPSSQDIVTGFQAFKEKPGTERWDFKLPSKLAKPHIMEEIIHCCATELGLLNAIYPKDTTYNGILFLGAALDRVINRLEFLNKSYNNGLQKNVPVYILTGERALAPKAGETWRKLQELFPEDRPEDLQSIQDEQKMVELVFRHKCATDIQTIMVAGSRDPIHTRATTSSTFETFLDIYTIEKKPYTFLAISNQPYVEYQKTAMENILRKRGLNNISVEVVGSESSLETLSIMKRSNYVAILLDTIAKILWNEEKRNEP